MLIEGEPEVFGRMLAVQSNVGKRVRSNDLSRTLNSWCVFDGGDFSAESLLCKTLECDESNIGVRWMRCSSLSWSDQLHCLAGTRNRNGHIKRTVSVCARRSALGTHTWPLNSEKQLQKKWSKNKVRSSEMVCDVSNRTVNSASKERWSSGWLAGVLWVSRSVYKFWQILKLNTYIRIPHLPNISGKLTRRVETFSAISLLMLKC